MSDGPPPHFLYQLDNLYSNIGNNVERFRKDRKVDLFVSESQIRVSAIEKIYRNLKGETTLRERQYLSLGGGC
jgi:two-component sensor histidine kinase